MSQQKPQPTNKTPAGLELAYDLEKRNIQNGLDAFVLSLHWSIIRTGLLQRVPNSSPSELTERLPPDWPQRTATSTTRTLSLFYYDRLNPQLRYELKVIELTPNDMVAVTIFRSPVAQGQGGGASGSGASNSTQQSGTGSPPATTPPSKSGNRPASKVSSGQEKNSAASTFQIGNFIRLSAFGEGKSRNKATDVYEHADGLETQLYESIMEPLGLRVMGQPPVQGPYDDLSKDKTSSSNQSQTIRERDPLLDDRFFHPDIGRRPSPPGMPLGPLHVPPVGGPGGIGRSDLDPLGRFGAGNVLDPRGFRNPRGGGGILPGLPGGIPPGARFDPFGPPNPNRPDGGPGAAFGNPNPDVERPPSSDYDDMFM